MIPGSALNVLLERGDVREEEEAEEVEGAGAVFPVVLVLVVVFMWVGLEAGAAGANGVVAEEEEEMELSSSSLLLLSSFILFFPLLFLLEIVLSSFLRVFSPVSTFLLPLPTDDVMFGEATPGQPVKRRDNGRRRARSDTSLPRSSSFVGDGTGVGADDSKNVVTTASVSGMLGSSDTPTTAPKVGGSVHSAPKLPTNASCSERKALSFVSFGTANFDCEVFCVVVFCVF